MTSETRRLQIPKSKHTLIVGKGGSTIRTLEEECQVRIAIPKVDDPSREVVIRGLREDVVRAQSRIEELARMKLSTELLCSANVLVPSSYLGLLVGKGGSKLKELSERFNVDICIPKLDPLSPSAPPSTKVLVEGCESSLKALHPEIVQTLQLAVMMNIERPTSLSQKSDEELFGSNRGSTVHPMLASSSTPISASASDIAASAAVYYDDRMHDDQLFSSFTASSSSSQSTPPLVFIAFVPKSKHPLIIGKGGSNIRELESQHRVRIEIPRSDDLSRKIIIRGNSDDVAAASRVIEYMLGGPKLVKDQLYSATFSLARALHGAIIGKGGSKLRELEEKTQCAINVPNPSRMADSISNPEMGDQIIAEGSESGLRLLHSDIVKMVQQEVPVFVRILEEPVSMDLGSSRNSGKISETECASSSSASSAQMLTVVSKMAQLRPKLDLTLSYEEAIFFPDGQKSVSSSDSSTFSLDRFLDFIRAARVSMDICVFSMTDDQISDIVFDAHSSGVKVRIITDNNTYLNTGSDIEKLCKSGIPVMLDTTAGHMHNKFVLLDGRVLMSGSFNWTTQASRENFENVVVTSSPKLVSQFQQYFQSMWSDRSKFQQLVYMTP